MVTESEKYKLGFIGPVLGPANKKVDRNLLVIYPRLATRRQMTGVGGAGGERGIVFPGSITRPSTQKP